MRDLTSRLRDIVRQNPPAAQPAKPVRELTYVPDVDGEHDAGATARRLGGSVVEHRSGSCVVVERSWDGSAWHGNRRVGSMVLSPDAPLSLFDGRLAALTDWGRRVVFFDIESTGLSGGAGTIAFLAGCGWFEGDAFHVRQYFLNAPAGERAMLAALADLFEGTSLLVTYNGRTFDVPTMETRWAFHRESCATDDLPHFDMLPSARRLWGRTGGGTERRSAGTLDTGSGCGLTSLERSVLGFHRIGDVPGFEIPARYFHFLRTGDAESLVAVLEHNRLDLLSLAAVMVHALELAERGPQACRDAREQLGLGRLYERQANAEMAAHAYQLAAASDDREIRIVALARLAEVLRRANRHDEAAHAWQRVLDQPQRDRALTRLERRAAEGLAIHLEHRQRDPAEAQRYAELLKRDTEGRGRADAEHRLNRLARKVSSGKNTKGGPSAAPLFPKP